MNEVCDAGQIAEEVIAQLSGARVTVTPEEAEVPDDVAHIVNENSRALKFKGYEPVDREQDRLGYDIESRDPSTGCLRFIEVKGRVSGAETITVTRNEVLTALNKPDDYILAIVEFLNDGQHCVHYLRQPFRREPDFGATSVNYSFAELLAWAGPPG